MHQGGTGGGVSGREIGTVSVRGAATTHDRARLNLRDAARAAPRVRAAIDSSVKVLGTSKLPADVWVDHQGRLRKLRYATSGDGSFTFTLELYDFGVVVDAQLPPPDQITAGPSQ